MNYLRDEIVKYVEPKSNSFLLYEEQVVSYNEVLQNVLYFQKWLSDAGVKSHERIALIFKNNSKEYVYTILSIIMIGAINCPISPIVIQHGTSMVETEWIVDDGGTNIKNFLFVSGFAGLRLNRNEKIYELFNWMKKAAFILPTSGTSGRIKWVVLSDKNILYNVNAIKAYIEPHECDVFMPLKHLGHVSTITSDLLLAIFTHAKIVVETGSFNPINANAAIKRYGVSILTLVPTMLQMMLRYSPEKYLTSVKKISLVGGPSKPDLLAHAQKVLPWTKIYCGYGLTEASSRVTYLSYIMLAQKAGSIGIPIQGTNLKLISEYQEINEPNKVGEIVVEGPGVMLGYFYDGKILLNTGQLYTNDLAYRDSDGYLFHVGRKDDILVVNGNNISTIFIEKLLEEHPQVESAHIFLHQESSGNEFISVVIVHKEGVELSKEEIYRFAQTKLSPSLIPKRIWFTTEIPCNTSGKISREKLNEQYK